MNGTCEVMKVKPWGKDQGDYVEINVEDFDKDKHQKYSEARSKPATKKGTASKSEG